MGALTKIQWCHRTYNPWRGCTKISEGCAHCYAEASSKRNPAVLGEWGPGSERASGSDNYLRQPIYWDRQAARAGERHRVFCLSLGDWLEDRRDLDVHRAALIETIAWTPNLDWLLLTKRPEHWRCVMIRALNILRGWEGPGFEVLSTWMAGSPPRNVWLGASVENRVRALERIPLLRSIPAAVRFLSAEPLLGRLDELDLSGIDWMILGGESGPHARPCHVDWIVDQVVQCRAQGVAAYVKQLGSWVEDWCHESYHPLDVFPDDTRVTEGTLGGVIPTARIHLKDPKGGDPDEWAEMLRVREFPR